MVTFNALIQPLPPSGITLDSPAILRALVPAHRHLAELKGSAKGFPHAGLLLNTLTWVEARASCQIEGSFTTPDELFQADTHPTQAASPAAREVARYRQALMQGFESMRDQQGALTAELLAGLCLALQGSPPPDTEVAGEALHALEAFINDPSPGAGIDPLVCMALAHHQLASSRAFGDSTGQMGRMLCLLYLTQAGLLDAPVLCLSPFLSLHQGHWQRLLQAGAGQGEGPDQDQWEEWTVFTLQAIAQAAQDTLTLVDKLRQHIADTRQHLRQQLPRLYSEALLANLFHHPYTRIEFVQNDLGVTRQTAAKYLRQLAAAGLVREQSAGKAVYFINEPLVGLLFEEERPLA